MTPLQLFMIKMKMTTFMVLIARALPAPFHNIVMFDGWVCNAAYVMSHSNMVSGILSIKAALADILDHPDVHFCYVPLAIFSERLVVIHESDAIIGFVL
jgi:hypothetical protein